MHLISDATGETLNTVARAAAAYYADYQAVEHIYALVRSPKQLDRVIEEVERQPGIVLFTLADRALRGRLESRFNTLGIPCLSILDPVISSNAETLGKRPSGVARVRSRIARTAGSHRRATMSC